MESQTKIYYLKKYLNKTIGNDKQIRLMGDDDDDDGFVDGL